MISALILGLWTKYVTVVVSHFRSLILFIVAISRMTLAQLVMVHEFWVIHLIYVCVILNNIILLDESVVSCKYGQAIKWEVFCESQGQCPISTDFTSVALKSNCSRISNHFCPMNRLSSKICMDEVNVSITDYCSSVGDEHVWECPSANSGLKFEQCYSE